MPHFPPQNPGQDTHASSVGVMGTTIDAIKLVLTSVLSTGPWRRDPNVVQMPWNSEIEKLTLARADTDTSASHLPLKIGIYSTDRVVTPHPPVRRGLHIVRAALEAQGHKVKLLELNSLRSIDKKLIDSLVGCWLGSTFAYSSS